MSALSTLTAAFVPASTEDIRDIRPPLAIPVWWHWPLAIALSALAALAVVMLVRWLRARAARQLTPHERARAALRIAEQHARAGRSREWAEVVAETLRGALSFRLGSDILPKTTSELKKATWAHWAYGGPVGPSDAALPDAPQIIDVLEACDLARFALATIEVDALVAWTSSARDAVDRLFSPVPEASSAPLARQTATCR
jgi:hypothetical protein